MADDVSKILIFSLIAWFLYSGVKRKSSANHPGGGSSGGGFEAGTCPAGYSPYTSYDPQSDTFLTTCQPTM